MVESRGSCLRRYQALQDDSRGRFGGGPRIGFGRGAKGSECQSGASSVRRVIGWTRMADS